MSGTRSDTDWVRIVLVVLAVVVVLPLVSMGVMMPMMGMWGYGGMGSGMWGSGMGGGYAPLWGLGMMVLWLVVLGGLGYVLYRGLTGSDVLRDTDPALVELRVAYARGDITDEEYERRRERLSREE